MLNYIIGSGFHKLTFDENFVPFACLWYQSIIRQDPESSIVVVTTGEDFPIEDNRLLQSIRTSNLGHVGDLIAGEKSHKLCGWSASVMALCLIAYNSGKDLVYIEEDCLCFGPWLEQAYADMGEADCVFGRKHESAPWQPCSNSLFIVRHRFLLEFVQRYLALPPDGEMTPENKFAIMEADTPQHFARLGFGVDRERPLPWEATVWYAQRWTADELRTLAEKEH